MSETDQKLEALAFKAASAHTSAGGSYLKSLNEYGKRCWGAAVKALLEELNCVSPAGEVYVPDVKAAVAVLERAIANCPHGNDGDAGEPFHDRCYDCPPDWKRSCHKLRALRALTGGPDEG